MKNCLNCGTRLFGSNYCEDCKKQLCGPFLTSHKYEETGIPYRILTVSKNDTQAITTILTVHFGYKNLEAHEAHTDLCALLERAVHLRNNPHRNPYVQAPPPVQTKLVWSD